jgi:ribonuclease BN (tRNA processing enzyme)
MTGMADPGGCDCTHGPGAISLRSMLAVSMSAVIGGAVLSTSACGSEAPQKIAPALPGNALITLGIQAGPPPVPNKTGISTALKIGSDVYQIDCGLGSLNAFTNAGFRFDDLNSVFITHLHTDHIVDYFSFFLSGGYTASKGKAPVMVYGPGPGRRPTTQPSRQSGSRHDRSEGSGAGVGRHHRGSAAGVRLHQQHFHPRHGNRRHPEPREGHRDRGATGVGLPQQVAKDGSRFRSCQTTT